jgi:PEP-CTERM motif-containing protein
MAIPAAGQVNVLQCPITMPLPTLCTWDDPGVWSNGVPDGTTDISLPGGFVLVNINATNGHVLNIAAPAHLFTQSSIQFANSGSSAVINNSGNFVNSGVLFNQLGATLNNLNQLDNNGIISNRLSGTLANFALATFNNNAGGFLTNDLSSTITNSGAFNNNSGATLSNFGTFTNDGSLNNNLGATFSNFGMLTSSQAIFNAGTLNNTGTLTAAVFSNSGTVNNAAGTMQIGQGGNPVTNSGLLEATGGSIQVLADLNNAGGTISGNGGSVQILGANVNNAGGTIGAANGGSVALNQTIANTGGTITALNGGTVTLAEGTVIAGGTLDNVNGAIMSGVSTGIGIAQAVTLDGAFGAITIKGTFTGDLGSRTLLQGTFNNQGNIQLNSGGGLNTRLTLESDVTLQGGGKVTLANTGGGTAFLDSALASVNGLTLTNVDNTIQGAGIITGTTGGLGALHLVNQAAGTVNANISGAVLELDDVVVTNTGLMEATGGGTLLFAKNLNSFSGYDSFLGNMGGTVAANGGTVFLEASVSNTGGTITALNGGTVNLIEGTFISGGTLDNVNGAIVSGVSTGPGIDQAVILDGAFGAITIKGTFTGDLGSRTLLQGTINNQGNIQLNSGGGLNTRLTLESDVTLQGGGKVTLANTGGGTAFLDSALASVNGLTLTNVDNTIQGAGTITGLTGGLGALHLVNEAAGTILANVPGQILAINGATLTNAGTVQVNAGSTLQVIAPFSQTGGKTQVDGTMLAVLGENVSGGTVLGTGIINGNVTLTGGTMQPGGLTTPGKLTINGDYSHSAALFNELIGSTGNGLLFINGASTLGPGALLNIDLLGSFTPFSGETFTLMDFLTGSGTFANAPTTGFQMDGFNWTIAYNANDIVLDAGSPVTGGGGGGTTPTPEPSSLLLLSAGLAGLACSLWKKRAAATR